MYIAKVRSSHAGKGGDEECEIARSAVRIRCSSVINCSSVVQELIQLNRTMVKRASVWLLAC